MVLQSPQWGGGRARTAPSHRRTVAPAYRPPQWPQSNSLFCGDQGCHFGSAESSIILRRPWLPCLVRRIIDYSAGTRAAIFGTQNNR